MKQNLVTLAVTGAFLAFGSAGPSLRPTGARCRSKTIEVFHPGLSPIEWVTKKADHSGSSGPHMDGGLRWLPRREGQLSPTPKRVHEFEPKGPEDYDLPRVIQAAYDATVSLPPADLQGPGWCCLIRRTRTMTSRPP